MPLRSVDVYAIHLPCRAQTGNPYRDVRTGAWTPLTKEMDAVDQFGFSSDGQMIALVFDRGSTSELQVLDVATMKPRTLPALPAGVITRLGWRPGSRELAFTFANVKTFGDVFSIDTSLGTLTRWTTSEVSGFNPESLPAPEVVEWRSFDGLPISGILYRPPAKFTGPRPVMINIHGGPIDRSLPRGHFGHPQSHSSSAIPTSASGRPPTT